MTDVDESKLMAFVGKVIGDLGAMTSAPLVVIGDQLGLYRAMADGQPVTAAELAGRTGTAERYVREWLAAQAASGYVSYDGDGRYHMEPEQAVALTDETSPACVLGGFEAFTAAVRVAPRLAEAFRTGEGVGWHEHDPGLFRGTARFFRPGYAAHLTGSWLPALDGITAKLAAGARVADVGCGLGYSTLLMAQAYPAGSFVGYDYHLESIDAARKLAAEADITSRVRFEVAGAKDFPGRDYDLITYFDCLHDMGDPVGALAHARSALTPERRRDAGRALCHRRHRGQSQQPRPVVLLGIDSDLHARLAVPGRRCRAGRPGRRGPAPRGGPPSRLQPLPPRHRDTVQPRAGSPALAAGRQGA